MTNEIKINQIKNILETLNTMHQNDYGKDYANVKEIEDFVAYKTMEIDCQTAEHKIAIIMLLNKIKDITIYAIGNTKIEIMFNNTK